MKKIILISMILAFALSAFGCKNKEPSSSDYSEPTDNTVSGLFITNGNDFENELTESQAEELFQNSASSAPENEASTQNNNTDYEDSNSDGWTDGWK